MIADFGISHRIDAPCTQLSCTERYAPYEVIARSRSNAIGGSSGGGWKRPYDPSLGDVFSLAHVLIAVLSNGQELLPAPSEEGIYGKEERYDFFCRRYEDKELIKNRVTALMGDTFPELAPMLVQMFSINAEVRGSVDLHMTYIEGKGLNIVHKY